MIMSANVDDDEDVHDENEALLSPFHVTHVTLCPHTEFTQPPQQRSGRPATAEKKHAERMVIDVWQPTIDSVIAGFNYNASPC